MSENNYLICPSCSERISIDEALKKKIETEHQAILKETRERVKSELEQSIRSEQEKKSKAQMQALKEIIESKEKELEEANKNEIELRKKRSELEAREKRIELDMLRKMDEERQTIESEISKRIAEDYHLKLAEKDKKLSDIAKQLEDSKRRAEQGTSVAKGDAFEEDLEQRLKEEFVEDEIIRFEKGKKGADIIQNIFHRSFKISTILWEAKNTASWQNSWIEKLKEDQRENKATYAVLISKVLPVGAPIFSVRDGIFVTSDFSVAFTLAYTLRTHLIKHHELKNTLKNEDENLRQLFDYLTSPTFKQRIEVIVERVTKLKENLNKERTAYEKIWAQREIDYQRILVSTARFYGEIKGISNDNLPDIPALALEH
ncbi:MAG: DUF2130 domain-containing protein [Oligoflexia bacterium]|nr:DUF2130 domain-containing protein [Oligoflexia bacterium]